MQWSEATLGTYGGTYWEPNENLMEHIGNKKHPKQPCSSKFVQVDDGVGKKNYLKGKKWTTINWGFEVKIINSKTWDWDHGITRG